MVKRLASETAVPSALLKEKEKDRAYCIWNVNATLQAVIYLGTEDKNDYHFITGVPIIWNRLFTQKNSENLGQRIA